ncbi:MAG: F0F1 ATP synthase subunit A [Candidatus Omnitrophica bacterium]|nr:F0F1 ATP synthase subunit A [Candidatus Omnitrophota bacterium]
MSSPQVLQTELPNIVTILERHLEHTAWAPFLKLWENVIFSLIIAAGLAVFAYFAGRKAKLIPGRLQNIAELLVGPLDEFVCAILGPHGRRYTPFIGTLFLYIFLMNISGLVPLFKSSTSSWSTTLALALCVFVYVQYTAIKELGFLGYLDHLMGNPRGGMALSIVMPLLMLFLHVITELVRPITLSLRLRSNIWGDDLLLAVLAGFGLKGVPLIVFSMLLAIIAATVQAVVFCLLTTIYFALILPHEEKPKIGTQT